MLPIIFGLFCGIIVCIYIQYNIKNSLFIEFIDSFIVYGSVFFLVVFGFLSLKIFHFQFIQKSFFRFLFEILFIGVFSYIYFILAYYLRGISIDKHHHYFIYFSLFFIVVHILLELCKAYSRSHSFFSKNSSFS